MKPAAAILGITMSVLLTACNPMSRYQGTAAGLDAVEFEAPARSLAAREQCFAPGTAPDAVGSIRFRAPRESEIKAHNLVPAEGRVELSPTGEPSWPWRVCLSATANDRLKLCTETFGYSPTASGRPQISVGRTCQTLQRLPR